MERFPELTLSVVSDAVPATREAAPSGIQPSKNCTVPSLGTAPATPDTVAVNVTRSPNVDGFRLDIISVLVLNDTVTLNVSVAEFPTASVAVTATVVFPTGNV